MIQDPSQDQVAFDESAVRRSLAQKIGMLTADNEMLLSALTLLRSENSALQERVHYFEVQNASDIEDRTGRAESRMIVDDD